MEFATIVAQPRTVIGKKVKALRRTGVLPGNVYGRGLESKAVQMDAREFVRTARASGVRSMFKLEIEGEGAPRYVLIRGLMREGGMGQPRHVDFYQVDLSKPIDTPLDLVLTGEAPAVRDLAGTLQPIVDRILIRTLPLNIPERLEVDLGLLTSFETTLTAADIVLPDGVTLVDPEDMLLVKVNPPRLRLEGDDEEGGSGDGGGEPEGE